MGYNCECCGKFVEDTDKYGSCRFCSRTCANTRKHSTDTKDKIRTSLAKQTICYCAYCGKEFHTLTSKANHEKLCNKNPNRLANPSTYHPAGQHKSKLSRKVVLYQNKAENIALDITYGELDNYRQKHTVCEICGKAVEDAVKYTGKFAAKRLCVDHDHKTNKFRGLLCQVCNRQLGWYENNEEKIKQYLHKK